MKKLLLLILLSIPLVAQVPSVTSQQPDCWQPVNFRANAAFAAFDNTTKGCTLWAFQYAASGYGGVSIVVQTAPAIGGGAGSVLPGAWSTFTAATGINPNTSTVGAISTFGTPTTIFAFVRVNLTASAGSGTLQGSLFGWRIPADAGGGSGGCAGTDATPCIVAGPTPDGSPVAFPGVLIAGTDGTDVWSLFSDNFGGLYPAGISFPLADGAPNTISTPTTDHSITTPGIIENRPFDFNGASWDRHFTGTLSAAITITTAATVVVSGAPAETTRITALSFSLAAATTVKIVEGTTMATPCDTGQVALSGTYQNVQYFSPPISGAIFTQTQGDDVCLLFGGVSTGGGLAQYAQY